MQRSSYNESMGIRGLKICKACHRSFEPQLTDEEIRELWFTEEQLAQDKEHVEMTGHGHLMAPYQELCMKCSMDPDLEMLGGGIFGTPVRYRKRPKRGDRPRRLKVEDLNPVPQKEEEVHEVETTNGLKMTIHGPLPPQEVIDAMGAAVRSGAMEGTVKPVRKAKVTIIKKRPSLWDALFGKRKKK